MEAADSGARQSRHSATNSEHQIHHPPQPDQPYSDHRHHHSYSRDILLGRSYREPSAMATATLITPAAHYQPQPQPPFSSYSQPSSGAASIANMISEPRKAADDQEPSNRQSLPSISEVIQGTKPGPYPVAHAPGLQSGSSLPSPFAPAPRSFPEAEKRSSPQPLHPTSSFPRQDGPAFADSPRPHFSNRPSLPPVSDRRQSPSAKADLPPHHHHHPEQKLPEPHHPLNGAYAHPPPPPPAPVAYQPGQLPPGQMPLPAYPISPRHGMPPHIPGSYDPRAPHVDDPEYARARYEATVDRHYESWNYQDSLSRVSHLSCMFHQEHKTLTFDRLAPRLVRFLTLPKLTAESLKNSTELILSQLDCLPNEKLAICSAISNLSRDHWSKCVTWCKLRSRTNEPEKGPR
ncbi:hypothetical protein FOYG_08160 [Fusarium oxysporum NRRL 32931]|uniref:Uncharacterized protein n=2 Tax=Fusarium oxysporum NRRL 32931 TaxID=660029 RepID=W9ID16_FUSOX|nr:hypothetical protein FOYG_08160 [Fusarium oxysporum NRRL 32931]